MRHWAKTTTNKSSLMLMWTRDSITLIDPRWNHLPPSRSMSVGSKNKCKVSQAASRLTKVKQKIEIKSPAAIKAPQIRTSYMIMTLKSATQSVRIGKTGHHRSARAHLTQSALGHSKPNWTIKRRQFLMKFQKACQDRSKSQRSLTS